MPRPRGHSDLAGRSPSKAEARPTLVEPGEKLGNLHQGMNQPTVEDRVEVAAVERPAVEPQMDAFGQQIFKKILAGRLLHATERGAHLVIVMKHGGRAEKLHRANRSVAENMHHGEPLPSNSNLHENGANLR